MPPVHRQPPGSKVANPASLDARLRSRFYNTFREAAHEAVMLGPRGDRALAVALRSQVGDDRLTLIAALLGDLHGRSGTNALRSVLKDPTISRDLRCASLLALAKREESGAASDLRQAMTETNATVRDYAVLGLAVVGGSESWDEMLDYLSAVFSRKRRLEVQFPTRVQAAVSYLAADPSPIRQLQLIGLLRQHWSKLSEVEQRWITENWSPSVPAETPAAEVPPPPDDALRQAILSRGLFGPL